MSDFVTNIILCSVLIEEQISTTLVYYSHVPIIVLGLFLSIYFLIKDKKNNLNHYFFILVFLFIMWVIFDLIVWRLLYNSPLTMFAWSLFEITEVLFFFIAVNFAYYFFFNKNIANKFNFLLLIPIIPTAYFTFTGQILENYDILVCEATEEASHVIFVWIADLFYLFSIISIYLISFKKDKINRLKNSVFFGGLISFLILYLISLYIADYVENYNWSLWALAGMPIFLAVIAFSAVRFKIFNVKILGAQVLVFLSIFMVATQFIFIQNDINKILNAVTLIILIIGGVLLIKSVKKVDEQREALDLANKQQTNLLHFISHQVKGFFTKSRNAFSGLLEGDYGPIPETARHIIQEGFDSDNRGVQTVQEILSAANLKTGQTTYVMSETNLVNVIKDILLLLKPASDKKSLTINFNPPTQNLIMNLDTAQITQALKNLIDNSIKYTPSGKIDITLEVQEKDVANKKVVIKISDTGVGISAEDMPKLFSEGGRGKDSIKINVDSTGYGLYIVKNIIEAHGGSVTVHSDGMGKGSVFTVVLPVK
jgi:signal transduction histidine kinase